jgi:hypothetical protein
VVEMLSRSRRAGPRDRKHVPAPAIREGPRVVGMHSRSRLSCPEDPLAGAAAHLAAPPAIPKRARFSKRPVRMRQ